MAEPNYEMEILLGLKPFAEFEGILSPILPKRIPEAKRKKLLKQVYDLAAQKVIMEGDKEGSRRQAKLFRNDRLKMRRVRAHLQCAIREIKAADSIYPQEWKDFELIECFDVKEIITSLDKLRRDIQNSEQEYAAITHPALRTPEEKQLAGPTSLRYPFAGMKSTAIAYWFISSVERCLTGFALTERIYFLPTEIDRIISRAFQASFTLGGDFAISRVKTARRRLPKTSSSTP
jgi:hypothetical protein